MACVETCQERALQQVEVFDMAGIGAGPANLSLAALMEPIKGLTSVFLERQPKLAWHEGLLLPNSELQVSFLKDLVTPVDPRSRYGFLSFLYETGRLYRFIVAQFPRVSRIEFAQYMNWVAHNLRNVQLGLQVHSVSFNDELFRVEIQGVDSIQATNIVLGVGLSPIVPQWATRSPDPNVFHSAEFLFNLDKMTDKHVMVVGGGQSGAEVVYALMDGRLARPRSVTWISRRACFLPRDESPFVNEFFFPEYTDHFYGLERGRRAQLLGRQRLASEGISPDLLKELYLKLYQCDFLLPDAPEYQLIPDYEVVKLERRAESLHIDVARDEKQVARLECETLILCTGYEFQWPDCVSAMRSRLHFENGAPLVREDYSIDWDGPRDRNIYLQNGARLTHGIADPNLSLLAWRSAVIANSVAGYAVYRPTNGRPTITFDLGDTSTRKDRRDGWR